VVGLEPDERAVDGIAGDEPAGVIRGVQLEAVQVGQLRDGMAATVAQPVAADVEDDAAEPLLEPVAVAQGRETAPGKHRGVVGRVLGLGRIAQDDARQAVARIEMPVDERENSAAASRRTRSTATSAAISCHLSLGRLVGPSIALHPTDVTDGRNVLRARSDFVRRWRSR